MTKDDPNSKEISYDFDLLKGIIFGLRTLESAKMEIIELIQKNLL